MCDRQNRALGSSESKVDLNRGLSALLAPGVGKIYNCQPATCALRTSRGRGHEKENVYDRVANRLVMENISQAASFAASEPQRGNYRLVAGPVAQHEGERTIRGFHQPVFRSAGLRDPSRPPRRSPAHSFVKSPAVAEILRVTFGVPGNETSRTSYAGSV